MNILLIVIIILLAVFAFIGYRRGLLGILFNLISWIFIVVFVMVANPYIYNFLAEHTNWYQSISTETGRYVDGKIEEAVGSSSLGNVLSQVNVDTQSLDTSSIKASDIDTNNVTKYLADQGITIPEALTSEVVNNIQSSSTDVVQSAKDGIVQQGTQIKDNVVTGIGNTIASYILKGISFLIAFVIAKLICMIVYGIIKHFQNLPIVHGICSWIGLVLGVVKGLLLVWLFMMIVSMTTGTGFGNFFLPMIEQSTILTFLYQNNLVADIAVYFV